MWHVNMINCIFSDICQISPVHSHCIHYLKYGANGQTLLQVSLLGRNSNDVSKHHLFFRPPHSGQQMFEQMLSRLSQNIIAFVSHIYMSLCCPVPWWSQVLSSWMCIVRTIPWVHSSIHVSVPAKRRPNTMHHKHMT